MKVADLKYLILEAYEEVLFESADELSIGTVKNIDIFVNDQSSISDTMFYRLVDNKSGKEFEVSVDVAGEQVDLNYVKEENPILAKIGFPHGDAIGNYIVKDINKELDDDDDDFIDEEYKPGSIAPEDLYYSDKHGRLVAMDDVDYKYHDSLELVYKKGDKIEGPMDEKKGEIKEAPEGVHYIKVESSELNEALDILEAAFFNDEHIKFELNDPDTIYIRGAEESDIHDAYEELQQSGIIVDETSIGVELQEGTGNTKKGTWAGRPVIIHMDGPDHEWKVEFTKTGKVLDYVEVMANLKFDDGTDYRDYLNESLVEKLDEADEDEEAPEDKGKAPEKEDEEELEPENDAVLEDTTDTIIQKFPTLEAAIVKLQTEDYMEFVDKIDWISPRPTSFKVNLKNGQNYILKWTGDGFEAQIQGKKYFLNKIDDYQQALDRLNILYKEGPMSGAGEGEGAEGIDDASTGGGDFPGEEGGGDSGDGFDNEGEAEGGDDAGAEEPTDVGGDIDFEDGAEPDTE